MPLNGFWSYVRDDDAAEGGRIVQLAHDIVAQFEMLTNESVDLFLDRDSLEWGAQWQQRIEGSLATVAFFVPILTPRYFLSAACRNELNTFARRASDLGVRELLLPILYMDVPGADAETPEDELVTLARSFQWVDWREHRWSNRGDGSYRRAVAELAQRLVEANRDAEAPEAAQAAIDLAERMDDDEAGTLEVLAEFEMAMPELTATLEAIGVEVTRIGEVTQAAGVEISDSATSSNPFARRLLITRQLAAGLTEPAQNLGTLGETFTRKLHDIDLGIRAIIAKAPDEPESAAEFCTFAETIKTLVLSADEGLGAIEGMVDSAAQIENLSREIRPVVREMRRGLTLVVEGRQVMHEWADLIDASGIDCSSVSGEAAS
jgi:hypothetical protein